MNSLFKQYEGVFDSVPERDGGQNEKIDQEKTKKETIFSYNPFALQDAIGEKNIKNIWIEYQKLIFDGVEPEELIYKIINKVRDMLSIKRGATALDLGIKDYPFSKSKKDLKNWEEKDLEDFYTKLVFIYHNSRMGGDEIGPALEKALLKL